MKAFTRPDRRLLAPGIPALLLLLLAWPHPRGDFVESAASGTESAGAEQCTDEETSVRSQSTPDSGTTLRWQSGYTVVRITTRVSVAEADTVTEAGTADSTPVEAETGRQFTITVTATVSGGAG